VRRADGEGVESNGSVYRTERQRHFNYTQRFLNAGYSPCTMHPPFTAVYIIIIIIFIRLKTQNKHKHTRKQRQAAREAQTPINAGRPYN